MASPLKSFLIGRPLKTELLRHQRVSRVIALATLSSDALSSVAYGTEEILFALVVAGSGALRFTWPIALAIAALMVIVGTSYRQTIKAYPSGGGSYIVSHENLGVMPGLVAGASLLVDYVLTVAVSVSAGTAAISSAFPAARPFAVEIALAMIVLLALANLRGVRESGALFAGPTYLFVLTAGLLVVVGLFRFATGNPVVVPQQPVEAAGALTLFLVLRAFASGCSAMTGVEAIANGVQIFKQPEAANARATLAWMVGMLVFLFLGVSALATLTHVRPGAETILSQLGRGTFGTGAVYYVLQVATAGILVLAANTSYADFPRLGSIMANDGYLPRQLRNRGDRLVFSNGMLLLTALAAVLVAVFRASTNALIPLYAVGVFTAFTFSQTGMVVHHLRLREPGWHWSIVVNGAGAVTTGVVLAVLAVAKFAEGAWFVLVLIPVLVVYFRAIKAHYDDVARRLALPERERCESVELKNHVIVLVSRIDRRLRHAMAYARSLQGVSCEALFVDVFGDGAAHMRRDWDECGFDVPLVTLPSPYRELIGPIREYVRGQAMPYNDDEVVTIILPEWVPEKWSDYLLHDPTPLRIKTAMFTEPDVIVTDVPYHFRAKPSDVPPGRV
ncbi:MAG TPA: APC family permease [Coriobacteriia bacterium]|jgi:amino acid transporter